MADQLTDFSTVQALSAQLGVDTTTARRLLEKAGVRVIEDAFSVSALQRALGSVAPEVDRGQPATPTQAHRGVDASVVERGLQPLLERQGLALTHPVVRRTTLEVTLVPVPGGRIVYYCPSDAHGDDEESLDGDDRADEAIEISNAQPRTARVFALSKERHGTLDFTVGRMDKPMTDFAIFVGPAFDRAWMITAGDLKVSYAELMRVKADPAWPKPELWKGVHLSRTPNTLRLLFTRSTYQFELSSRLRLAPEEA